MLPHLNTVKIRAITAAAVAVVIAAFITAGFQPAVAAGPIKVGFGMALSGPLAPNGRSALLAMKIWASR